MSIGKTTKRDKTRHSAAKNLRDQAIVAKAIAGEKVAEIAKEVGLSRSAVSKILNSDEVKAKVAEIDGALAAGIEDAINTILTAAKSDPIAAKWILENFGAFSKKVQLSVKKSLEEVIGGSFADEGDEK